MDWGQRLRRWRRRLGSGAPAAERPAQDTLAAGGLSDAGGERVSGPADVANEPAPGDARGWLVWALIVIVGLAAAYYPVGAMLDHQVNDDLAFAPTTPAPGASHAVAAAVALITREVDETGWVANTPPFAPNALLRFGGNMANFQVGLIQATGEFALAMRRYGGRGRGGSAEDPDLEAAAGRLQIDGERWVLRPNLLPQRSSPAEYRTARDVLVNYNARLVRGEAELERGRDNLQRVVEAIALDLGSDSAALDEGVIRGRTVLIDRRADKIFYRVKGKAYGYLMLLRGLRTDFADIIEAEERVAARFSEAMGDLERAAGLRPAVVMNGAPDGALAPNHLTSLGFYVLRARLRLREITDILQT